MCIYLLNKKERGTPFPWLHASKRKYAFVLKELASFPGTHLTAELRKE